MDKWEYLVELETDGAITDMLNRGHLENNLNNAGEEGWELVSAIPAHNDLLLIMKRSRKYSYLPFVPVLHPRNGTRPSAGWVVCQ